VDVLASPTCCCWLLQDGDTGVTVEQVSAAIKLRKAQLAPAIQELRSLRQQQQVRLRRGQRFGCMLHHERNGGVSPVSS
jgi:hypothetical protein